MNTQVGDRALLLNVAYRLLGSASDAEDAVQEAYARWYGMSQRRRDDVHAPTAWLVTTVSRICLDLLNSARARRERYVGEWLPEPVSASTFWTSHAALESVGDPAERVSLDESLSMALLVVLESMTPAERVAFVLHDVFGYPFTDVGDIVGRSPQACRQLASAARRHVREQRQRRVRPEDHAHVVAAFRTAWQAGDLTGLIRWLDPDATAIADGGGQVSAMLNPVHGAEPIAKLLLGVGRRQHDLTIDTTTVNAEPGLVARDAAGSVLAVMSVAVLDDHIDRIWVMRNPAKLTTWR
ncbi:RNA polymerase sigma-70 factor (ECF subfamily) [Haloactinopolyspora alba]|uniref:RNA polymerase sigma-70 factor (ECF subfamily) n=1 Tax=Haloactinopolyspora alba TaxID=648780 RepID=A0A2P8E583_9ACTN|nr:RNA polymerase sigma factor SigJ [Haloactinopolyspora alba]PSL04623.1 RNA polymerase sigma-70 factor (ECF subfamily) [Haloactinopolyspora alba]